MVHAAARCNLWAAVMEILLNNAMLMQNTLCRSNWSVSAVKGALTMLNMDFTQRAVINSNDSEWVASPKAGVWRKP